MMMRQLQMLLFLVSLCGFFSVYAILPLRCPSNLPKSCQCEYQGDKFRVACHNESNLNVILSSLEPEDTIDKLEIHHCNPPVKKLQILPLMKVKSLTLDGCGIEEIDENAFINVALEIDELKLPNNDLKKMPSVALLGNLVFLDLSHNSINQVLINGPMYRLKTIILDHNRIRRLDPLTFSTYTVPVLEKISLHKNLLSTISPSTFTGLDQLRVLMLANNSLANLEFGALDGMKNLQQLNLRNNMLQQITNFTLYSLPKLYAVDFSYNELSRIESGAFDKQMNLYWLDLSHNNIAILEEGTFKRKIANIIIDDNELALNQLNWFVAYLVENQVHTFFSPIPEPQVIESDAALEKDEANSKSSRNLRAYTIIGLCVFGFVLLLILIIHSCCSRNSKTVNLESAKPSGPLSLKNFRPGRTSTFRNQM